MTRVCAVSPNTWLTAAVVLLISSETAPVNPTPVVGLMVMDASALPAKPVALRRNNPRPPLTVSNGVVPSPSSTATFWKAIVVTVVGVAPTVTLRSRSKSPRSVCPATVSVACVPAVAPRTWIRRYGPPGTFSVTLEPFTRNVWFTALDDVLISSVN